MNYISYFYFRGNKGFVQQK